MFRCETSLANSLFFALSESQCNSREISPRGHVEVVQYLLKCGAPDVMSRDVHGVTPLHAATHARRTDVVSCLLDHLVTSQLSLDPEDAGSGATPLVLATRGADIAMVVFHSHCVRISPLITVFTCIPPQHSDVVSNFLDVSCRVSNDHGQLLRE